MSTFRALVNIPAASIGKFLKDQLSRLESELIAGQPGPAFVSAARAIAPKKGNWKRE